MKKFILALLLLLPVSAWGMSAQVAPDLWMGLLNPQVGTFWVQRNNNLYVGAEIPVIDYKNLVSANVGTIYDFTTAPPIIAGLNLNINTAATMLGLGYHLPGDSQIGVFYGWDFSVNELDDNRDFWGINWIIPIK